LPGGSRAAVERAARGGGGSWGNHGFPHVEVEGRPLYTIERELGAIERELG
jgi:hypothetical protein